MNDNAVGLQRHDAFADQQHVITDCSHLHTRAPDDCRLAALHHQQSAIAQVGSTLFTVASRTAVSHVLATSEQQPHSGSSSATPPWCSTPSLHTAGPGLQQPITLQVLLYSAPISSTQRWEGRPYLARLQPAGMPARQPGLQGFWAGPAGLQAYCSPAACTAEAPPPRPLHVCAACRNRCCRCFIVVVGLHIAHAMVQRGQ